VTDVRRRWYSLVDWYRERTQVTLYSYNRVVTCLTEEVSVLVVRRVCLCAVASLSPGLSSSVLALPRSYSTPLLTHVDTNSRQLVTQVSGRRIRSVSQIANNMSSKTLGCVLWMSRGCSGAKSLLPAVARCQLVAHHPITFLRLSLTKLDSQRVTTCHEICCAPVQDNINTVTRTP